jgi:hypothetical protein
MGSAFALGLQRAEDRRRDREAHVDEQRQATLSTLLQDASTPQDALQAINAVYAHEPSQTRLGRLYDHLTGKKTAPLAAPSVTTQQGAMVDPETGEVISQGRPVTVKGPAPRTRQEAIEGVAARGSTPEQRQAQGERVKEDAAYRLQQLKNQGAAGKSASSRPVPYYAGAIDKANAVATQQAGKVYMDSNGQPIDASKIPDGMFLLPVFAGGGQEYYELGSDKGRYETAGNERLFEPSVGNPNPGAPSIGPVRVPTTRSSTSTDPFGLTTTSTSTSTPQTTPAPTVGAPAPRPAASTGAPSATARPAGQVLPKGPAPRRSAAPQLDATGHIPATAANRYLVEAANSLLDGMDVNKLTIPLKDRTAAQELARQYGWQGQGTFTPQQKVLINEAGAKLQQLADSPALSVLDSGVSRAKIAAVLKGSDPKAGTMANQLATQTARFLNPSEQQFIREYNAAVGVIAGLGPITRGNRATEASIARLMTELPSVLQSANSKDAKLRVQQLLQEIQVAQNTTGATPLGGAKPAGPKQGGGNVIVVTPEDMK